MNLYSELKHIIHPIIVVTASALTSNTETHHIHRTNTTFAYNKTSIYYNKNNDTVSHKHKKTMHEKYKLLFMAYYEPT